jgi:hypothetical protein
MLTTLNPSALIEPINKDSSMSIRFIGKLTVKGKIIYIDPEVDDWFYTNLTEQRFEDRGLVTSPVTDEADWGTLPVAPV